MDIKTYLEAYGRDEDRLVKWLRENGANLLHAYNAINTFALENRQFSDGYEFDHAVLQEAKKTEVEPIKQYIDYQNLPAQPWYKRVWSALKAQK